MVVASNIDEKTLKKDGVCAASLPTTMGIVAGLLVQNALKYLLKFGKVTYYLGYNALEDFFPTMSMKPNPNCDDSYCRKRQKEYQENKPELPPTDLDTGKDQEIVHEENEWGICVIDESVIEEENLNIASGVKLAYSISNSNKDDSSKIDDDNPKQSLDELMAQLKQL